MKISYRPEIDGLRAIAVGIVILYHADLFILGYQPFKGGFIGVDIFFVISGYLITSIILKELLNTGSFSFRYFYQRRIRRILPVLFFIMLVTLPFAWMYILPESFIDFAKSILYSLGFSSNIYFHYSGQVYGAESGMLKPFLHTWSLSIEEQYYILFPIILLVAFKYLRKNIIHIFFIIFLISLFFAQWASTNYPSFNFYGLPTRAWELLVGSMLAYFETKSTHRSRNKVLNLILPFTGLILICHSVLFFNDKMYHPSFFTLSPIIGVCLIIWFSNKNELITRILSTKLFVGVGLISYSLYLWHYPIFAFARVTGFVMDSFVGKILLIPLIFSLSLFSYFYIEKPFRNKNYTFKNLAYILLTLLIILVSLSIAIIHQSGFKTRFPQIFQTKLEERNVHLFQKENLPKVVLIGDSHAAALRFNLNEELKKKNFSLFNFPTEMYLSNFNYINRKTKKIDNEFINRNNKIDNFLKENSNLIIILHYRWIVRLLSKSSEIDNKFKIQNNLNGDFYLYPMTKKFLNQSEIDREIKNSLISQINKIINQGHKLIIVYPVPEVGFNVPRSLLKKYFIEKDKFDQNLSPILTTDFDLFKKRNKYVFEIFDKITNLNIFRVYPHKYFCNTLVDNECVTNDNKSIFYHDSHHLSLKGSEFVVNDIVQKIQNIKID
jgi:peptidoglycan/LPS O-acetylase OafA/YrhL